ncbi:unnamed protein product, partial [Prunus brigantina]
PWQVLLIAEKFLISTLADWTKTTIWKERAGCCPWEFVKVVQREREEKLAETLKN